MLTGLVKATALMLTLCFLHGTHIRLWHQRPAAGLVTSGLLFGGIGVIGMLSPVVVMPGVIFDVRSVVLGMAGLFGGPIVAGIAAVMAATARLWIGGAGTGVGIAVIVIASAMGLVYRRAHANGRLDIRLLPLLVFGLLLHAAALGAAQFLPADLALQVNRSLALPLLLLSIPSTALVGMLLRDVEDRMATERALQESASRLCAITHAIPDVLLVLDARGYYIEVLSPSEAALVAPASQLIGKRLHDVLPAHEAERFMALIQTTLRSGQTESMEYRMRTDRKSVV